MADGKTFSLGRWQPFLLTIARWIPVVRPSAVEPAHNGKTNQNPPPVTRRQTLRSRWSRGEIVTMIGFAVTTVCVALISVRAYQVVTSLLSCVGSISQTRQIIEKIELVHSDLKDVESSARSFAISGKQSHLDPYYLGAKSATQNLDDLKKLVAGDPRQCERVTALEPLVVRHLGLMRDMVDLGNKHVFRAVGQTSLTDQGHAVMSEIRRRIVQMEEQERQSLGERERQAAVRAWEVRYSVLTVGVLAVALGASLTGCLYRVLLGRRKSEAKLGGLLESSPDALLILDRDGRIVTTNTQTERHFGYTRQELLGEAVSLLLPERFHSQQRKLHSDCMLNPAAGAPRPSLELAALHKDGHEFPVEITMKPLESAEGLLVSTVLRDISPRKRAEVEIATLHKELERRTFQFDTTNKELEAFSHSVSHDLRAPLRSIDGFSQVLLEDYADALDPEGKDCLQRVRAGCQHMGEIIDALLQLSRMTRTEMCRGPVDLSAMAAGIAAELKKREPQRQIEFILADGLTAEGDAKLLRVVLENLLGNAWKFTSKKPAARIEFGTLPQDNGQRVYFVRDDGAGFDMAHAAKLFNAFKRLHDAGEFPGTGIGLTTVQRVINRHGGKIWAEGVVGKGATFCFTLS